MEKSMDPLDFKSVHAFLFGAYLEVSVVNAIAEIVATLLLLLIVIVLSIRKSR